MTVKTMRVTLTEADIQTLVRGGDDNDRALAAHKICRKIDAAALTDEERRHADAILSFLAADAAELVRKALVITLKNSQKLPRDVALKLAQDVESVALPILASSPVLTDDDLVQLVRSSGASKQAAIAARPEVSRKLALVIAFDGAVEAVRALAANPKADLDETGMGRILVRFPTDEIAADALAMRTELPISIAEKLVSVVSGAAFDYLVNNHALPPQLAIELASSARERATIDLVAMAGVTPDLSAFVHHLRLAGKLNSSLILRAACTGQIRFVEYTLAELAGIPHNKAWLLVHDAGPLGLRALFERAGLPPRAMPLLRLALDTFHQAHREGADTDPDTLAQTLIERVLTKAQGLAPDDVDYLLERLNAYSGASGQQVMDFAQRQLGRRA